MTVFTITYNEAFMLPHFVAHYRAMFPGCRIVVYDNMSDDGTPEIAERLGCEVSPYDTGGKLDDRTYLQIKNNCWKGEDGWVTVADCDEFCDIDAVEVGRNEAYGASVIRFEGYNMVNMVDNTDFEGIIHGIRAESYDKAYMFNARKIKKINYGFGCHNASPDGEVVLSQKSYRARHYKYLNPDYMVRRHAVFASRMSNKNLKRGYGGHYLQSEQTIREEFEQARKKAIRIL